MAILVALLVLPLVKAADKSTPAVNADLLRSIVVENPDSVLYLLDKIEKSKDGSFPPFRISLLRALA